MGPALISLCFTDVNEHSLEEIQLDISRLVLQLNLSSMLQNRSFREHIWALIVLQNFRILGVR